MSVFARACLRGCWYSQRMNVQMRRVPPQCTCQCLLFLYMHICLHHPYMCVCVCVWCACVLVCVMCMCVCVCVLWGTAGYWVYSVIGPRLQDLLRAKDVFFFF